MKVTGEYMGKSDEMLLEVVQKEKNMRLVTRQTEVRFQKWESTQEFQINGYNFTRVSHAINHKLPTIGKIANLLSGSQAEGKTRQGIQ